MPCKPGRLSTKLFVIMRALAAVMLVAVAPPGIAQEVDLEELPQFENDDYILAVAGYVSSSEVNLSDPDESEHELDMGMIFIPPEDVDVVGVLKVFGVIEAIDDERDDIYQPSRRGRSDDEYVGVPPQLPRSLQEDQPRLAGVELKDVLFDRSPTTIRSLVVETLAVVAEEHESIEIPAIVTDAVVETGAEVTIRLSEMKISRDHEAEIILEFDREAGIGPPLIEAVYALDEDGDVIGGGRWTGGAEIFESQGEFKTEFMIFEDADVVSLRIVIVTEYQVEPVRFEITEIFEP